MTEENTAVSPPTPSPQPANPASVQHDRHIWLAPTALALAIVALTAVGGLFWHLQDRILSTALQVARRIGESIPPPGRRAPPPKTCG